MRILHAGVDRTELERELRDAFDADPDIVTVVARQARDLSESDQFVTDFGAELTVEDVIDNLADAPEEYQLAERWNWWLGALDLSHGGYARFSVRQDIDKTS
ncbi:hypothetical protein BVU17_12670 [Haloarcula taiwanensis]|uniref:Uncharacterized protein n=1 Tax=Haloarcula taiwanensis TaxID=1932004 RepID=A0A2H5A0T5_9EURY|nr:MULTISPECIES: hypothetical protein [Haloarcula]AUG48334.1 hypothetical protein BVU17_12670 [Haloarcula taiwanensis]RLM39690.1 hypothetical protein DVK01_03780 [Haloarcula sp. Atlit-120R]RLM47664.1 hypothetical protein DVK00_03935 [Haloarcula sp. Atlit-47R]RLM97122.1 hypothetical protein D3D01_04760 [Haloarcula sp. Atlit-7R]